MTSTPLSRTNRNWLSAASRYGDSRGGNAPEITAMSAIATATLTLAISANQAHRREPFDRTDQMQRASECQRSDRIDEDRLFEQFPEVIDPQHMEKHLPEKQQQPEQTGEQRRFGEHQFVAPGIGEERVVLDGPVTRRQPALRKGQRHEPQNRQQQRERKVSFG